MKRRLGQTQRTTHVNRLLYGGFMLFSLSLANPPSLQAMVPGVSQQERINLSFKNEKLSTVLKALETASGYKLMYVYDDVDNYIYSGRINTTSIDKALEQVLYGFPVIYTIEGRHITLRLKPEKKTKKVSGIVVSAENNEPMVGVSVRFKNTHYGTITGIDGKFTIEANTNSNHIVASFMGMETQTVKADTSMRIVLKPNTHMIKELVVTGYQTLDKTRIAGAVSTIRGKDLNLNGINSIEQALQGKIAGVAVTNTTGQVGVRQKTRVRGTSTMMGSQEPVWVVDGIIQEDPLPFKTQELDAQGGITEDNFDYIRNYVGNSISWLNPTDIESITVLKDASATAIYGVRAANGVIVIKTKRGKAGMMSVTYSGNINVGEKVTYDKLELMNSRERVAVSREIYERGLIANFTNNNIGYAGALNQYLNKQITANQFEAQVARLESTNTNWFNLLFRNPVSHSHNLSFSGGNEKTRYYSSLGYSSNKGTAIGNDVEGYNARVGLNMDFTPSFHLAFDLSGAYTSTDGFYIVDPYSYATSINRALSAFDDNGNLSYYKTSSGYLFNFINERDQTGNNNKSLSLNASINLNYSFTKSLRLQSLFSLSTSSVNGESYATDRTEYIAKKRYYDYGTKKPIDPEYKASQLPLGGEYNMNDDRQLTWNWRNSLSYDHLFNEVHALTAMLGIELSSIKYTGYSSTQYGYLRDRGKSFAAVPITIINRYSNTESANPLLENLAAPKVTDQITNNLGAYLTLNYTYDNRYVVNLSVRSDASNRFGRYTNENFNPVWAGGLRWNMANEKWFLRQHLFSDVSLRASYGFQRNMASNYSPSLIVKIPSGSAIGGTDSNTGDALLDISSLPYENLRWEKTISQNYGIDLGLFNNTIRLSFEYYIKQGKDMITMLTLPREYGIENMPVNGGSMNNHGYELTVGFTPVRTRNFTWDISLNTSKNFNEVTKVGMQSISWQTAVAGSFYKIGYPTNALWAFKFKGIDQNTGYPIIDLSTVENSDPTSDPTAYMEYVGKLDPDFTGGLSMSFRYKEFSLSSSFYLQLGGKRFLHAAYGTTNYLPSEYENLSSELNGRWKPGDTNATLPGLPDSNVQKQNIQLPGNNKVYANVYEMYNYSTARIVNASSFRCNNLSFSYAFPEKMIRKLMCKAISLSASVTNLFSIVSKDFHGRDPEVATGQQPRTRSYSLNLNVTF